MEIDVNNVKQYSECKDGVLADSDDPVFWNEHLFFEIKDLVRNQGVKN